MTPWITQLTTIALKGLLILLIVLFADNFIRNFSKRGLWAGKSAGTLSSGVIQGLLRGFVIGLGALIFLQLIGISITPILASLGVGSLAVALALQETLSNFFAGIYVSIDKPVQVGDFIRLESGDEGCVSDVGWRSTRIRTGANNTVIIPNSKLIGSVLTNYSLPTREIAVPVEITVAERSDLDLVEKATLETAAALSKEVLGVAKESEPVFHFHSFGEFGIRGTAILRAREFSNAGPIKHAFVKALHARFKKEGIEVPYRTKF